MRVRFSAYLLLLLILLALLSPSLTLAQTDGSELEDGDDEELTVTDDDAPTPSPPTPPRPPAEPDVPIIPDPTPSVEVDPAIPALLAYLKSGKVNTSAVRFIDTPRGRGLAASRPLRANSTIFSIPYSILLTADFVRNDAKLGSQLEDMETLDAFATWLAIHRRSNATRFAPHLRTLPPFVPLPLFYAPALADEYRGTFLEDVATDRRRTAYTVWAQMPDQLKARTTKADYMWALSILWSRSCAVAMKGGEGKWRHVAALAPLVDFMNTGNSSELNVRCTFGKSGRHFTCKAGRDVAKGEELLVSYGPRSNAALVHDYGFALPTNNPHDFVVIDLPDPKHNKTKGDNHRVGFRKVEVYEELLRQQKKTAHDLRFRLFRPPNFTSVEAVFGTEIIGWARLNVIKRYEQANLTAYDMIERIAAGQAFSAPNTLAAVQLIHTHLQKAIERYPHTIAEDFALLNNTETFVNNPPLYWIVMVRYSEKSAQPTTHTRSNDTPAPPRLPHRPLTCRIRCCCTPLLRCLRAILHDVSAWIEQTLPSLEKAAADEVEWRRRTKEERERQKKEREEAERKKALERERIRREEDAAEAARLKAIEDEEEEAEERAGRGRRNTKVKGKAHDELRRRL